MTISACRYARFSRPGVEQEATMKFVSTSILAAWVFLSLLGLIGAAQDLPNSKDPAGMKRYEGSELIGYRAPKFDEYLLPLGPPTSENPPSFEKSKPVEGQTGYYTYLAPAG